MFVHLSDEALDEYHRLERDEPDRFDLLLNDLSRLDALASESLDHWATIGGLRYCQGPTGRARYWLSVEQRDGAERVVVEYFDLD